MGTQSLAEASRCSHILIFQAPTLDSKMIKEVPREFASNMPRSEGLQPCCRDFHSGMVLPRMAPLVGPGRIGALAPLSYGIRPQAYSITYGTAYETVFYFRTSA
jgi:hypothetical protein